MVTLSKEDFDRFESYKDMSDEQMKDFFLSEDWKFENPEPLGYFISFETYQDQFDDNIHLLGEAGVSEARIEELYEGASPTVQEFELFRKVFRESVVNRPEGPSKGEDLWIYQVTDGERKSILVYDMDCAAFDGFYNCISGVFRSYEDLEESIRKIGDL